MTDSKLLLVRFGIVGLIWLGMFMLAAGLILTGSLANELAGFMGAVGFAAAAMGTAVILQFGRIDTRPAAARDAVSGEKRKNGSGGLDALDLLTDDDVAELREEIKHRLRQRLLDGEDGELGSLDALLAAREQRRER